jgi:hypothetical protein
MNNTPHLLRHAPDSIRALDLQYCGWRVRQRRLLSDFQINFRKGIKCAIHGI